MPMPRWKFWKARTSTPIPTGRQVSKEFGAGFWSKLFFTWMGPLMSLGYRRPLEHNDIWLVNPDRSVARMAEHLQRSFTKRVERGDKNPLIWSTYETFRTDILVGGFCRLVGDIFLVMAPFTLKYLIAYVDTAYHARRAGESSPGVGVGIGYVIGITVMTIFQSLGTSHFIYRGMVTGGQIRGVLISAIFQKSLRLSPRARSGGYSQETAKAGQKSCDAQDARRRVPEDVPGWGNGRIFNVMSTDTARIDQASGSFHLIWTSPFAILVALALLIVNLSYSAVAGFAVLVVGLASVTQAVKSLGSRRTIINKITDQRISKTREMLHAFRSVKLFGWEDAFSRRLEALRAKEVRSVRILLTTRSAVGAVSMAMPIFAQMVAFITYSYTVPNMDPAATFSSLALFASLRTPLNWIPLAIGHAIDARASFRRIEEFLLAEEIPDEAIHEGKSNSIELQGAYFTWECSTANVEPALQPRDPTSPITKDDEKSLSTPSSEQQQTEAPEPTDTDGMQEKREATASITISQNPFALQELNFTVGRSELIAVIGDVGSGKSSLLAAIAGDMRKTDGQLTLGGSRAYCPQYSWIQNASVRENIIFGTEFDSTRYQDTVRACSLQMDIDTLPYGDKTEIGERGVTLSGGQKQRINIARAIYVNRDIILMDDPLSAVDAHVGQHIFDHAILGMLSNKCRILATHQLQILSFCDRIVCMEDGRVNSIDTYENLLSKNNQLGRYLSQNSLTGNEKRTECDGEEKKLELKRSAVAEEIKTSGDAEGIMQDEGRTLKSVSWRVYAAYTRASGSMLNALWILVLLVVFRASNLMVNLWLAYWVSDDFILEQEQYIGIYVGLSFLQSLVLFSFSVSISMMGTHANKKLLNTAVRKLLRAPISFFDITPLGRILHRLSKDIDVMDNNLTDALRMFWVVLSLVVGSFILIIAYFYYFIITLVPLCVALLSSAAYYRASARELKRHQAIRDAHVFAKFSKALSGAACIRAYGLQSRFAAHIRMAIDEMNGAYFLTFSNQRWLGLRLDGVGIGLVFATGILVVVERFHISPSISGLLLGYILAVIELLQYIVRQLAEVENAMNGTERLHQYCTSIESEAPLELPNAPSPWPSAGCVRLDNVELRYRPGLPLALKGLSLDIMGGELMGVVGRTGAGKSSITTALFRLSELSGGCISIDGVDISKLGLHALRKTLSIIPQDPVLFAGTVRSNLDPFAQHSDYDLQVALQQTYLVGGSDKDTRPRERKKESRRVTLDSVVEEDGNNFSLGQRQLMAFARALIRGGKILVVDEGTSAVDSQTDEKIQRMISNTLRNTTRLIIAHRLRTVLSYDRVCVMDKGSVAEVGEPLELWRRGGIFRGMCNSSRIVEEEFLKARDLNVDVQKT